MDNISEKIIGFLDTKEIGASACEIAKAIGHNRITVTKYLEIMKAQGKLDFEGIASAKIWHRKKLDKPTILIVDDEPHVVDLVAISLIPTQYNIIKSYSGLDALEKVYSGSPDLVILDLMMPNVNGFEVCKKIKENSLTKHIPVIILSAKGELSDKLKGISLGADEYITKPFDPMELEARVGMVIRRTVENQDINPLTKLPGIRAAGEELLKKLSSGEDFVLTNFRITGIDGYIKDAGVKKGTELILLFGRMLSDLLRDKGFVSHTVKDSFIVFSPEEIGVKKPFKNLLSYLLGAKKNRLGININKIGSEELRKKKMPLDSVWEILEVS